MRDVDRTGLVFTLEVTVYVTFKKKEEKLICERDRTLRKYCSPGEPKKGGMTNEKDRNNQRKRPLRIMTLRGSEPKLGRIEEIDIRNVPPRVDRLTEINLDIRLQKI